MARPALNEEQIEAYRDRVVEAATRLFAKYGYESVSIRAIAAEVGASPMALYRYFENKAEIFAMVRAAAFRRFADVQEAAYQSKTEPLERLWAMRQAYFDFSIAEPNAYRVMFELWQAPEEDYPALAEQSARSFSALEAAVAEALAAGVIEGADPLTIAHQLWASTHGIVSLHLAGKLTAGRDLESLRRAVGPLFRAPGK